MLDDDGTKDCDAGHILAHRLGGPGNQPINIFPQDLSINRGAYNQYENSIYDCILSKTGATASLAWEFTYASSTNTKPSNIKYTAKYSGASCADSSQSFLNDSV